MKTFTFQTLDVTETKDGKMYKYVWNACPENVLQITTNKLCSKKRLGLLELSSWINYLQSI